MTINRIGEQTATLYSVSTSEPGTWSWLPQKRGIEVLALGLTLPQEVEPTSETFFNAMETTREFDFGEQVTADSLDFVSAQPVHVASMGQVPVAAVSPPHGAETVIDYVAPRVNPSDVTLRLRTGFTANTVAGGGDRADQVFLVDVLGPKVLLWTEIGQRRFPYATNIVEDPATRNEAVAGSVADVGVARTGPVIPMKLRPTERRYLIVLVERGMYSLRIGAAPVKKLDAVHQTLLDLTESTPSAIEVQIPRAVSASAELVPIFKRADQNPTVTLSDVLFMRMPPGGGVRSEESAEADLWDKRKESYDYPPTPPVSGVNIFGAISSLRLASAQGVLVVGKQEHRVSAPSAIELSEIRADVSSRNHIVVPVRVDRKGATVEVQGRAKARINTTAVALHEPLFNRALGDDKLMLVATLAAAIAATAGETFRRRRSHS